MQSVLILAKLSCVVSCRQVRVDAAEKSILRGKEGFLEVAIRGAVLYDAARVMPVLNPLYHISWKRFIK